MAFSDLPPAAKASQATGGARWMHFYWHLIKNPNFVNEPANAAAVQTLSDLGWSAVLTGQPGAGLDFLAMHRHMIHAVDQVLMTAGDPNWPRVTGWQSFPPGPNDTDWPEPQIALLANPTSWPADLADQLGAIRDSRLAATVQSNLGIATTLRSADWIRNGAGGGPVSLDRYGALIESTVHNWAHMRFAGLPPSDPWAEDPSADWLGTPFSSHVNAYFWKLHGWIDDCINVWEEAMGQPADLSGAWMHPATVPPPIWDLFAPMVIASSRDLAPSQAWGLPVDDVFADPLRRVFADPLSRAMSTVGFWRAPPVPKELRARFGLPD